MIEVVKGDITKLDVDPATRKRFAEAGAIVNAAKRSLFGGGGVPIITVHKAYALFILERAVQERFAPSNRFFVTVYGANGLFLSL